MGVVKHSHILFTMPRVKTFDQQQVLEKAMELFWEKGFAATSIQDLVSHLGINRASLYDTYGGKEELFCKSFELYRQKNTRAILEFLNNEPDVRKGLRSLFEMGIQEAIQDQGRKGCFVVNVTTELVPRDKKMLTVVRENKKNFEGIFLNYLQKGELENQFPEGKDLKAIASLLFTLYNGLKVVSKVEPEKEQMQRTVSTALSLLD